MTTKTCEECGASFTPTPRQRNRRFCSSRCALQVVTRQRTQSIIGATVEEVEHLLGTDSGDNIARRLGYASLKSLRASLRTWGRENLAERLRAEPVGRLPHATVRWVA